MTTSSIVAKSAQVLDTVCAGRTPHSFSQIAELTGLPKSSAHRILSILQEENLIAFDQVRQVYKPGSRLIDWAVGALNTNDLPQLSAEAMEALSGQACAHVALSILDGVSVLWLKTVEHGASFRLAPRVGGRSPVHVCAAGKALLAYVYPSRRDAILNDLTLERFTERTIVRRDVLEAELVRVRETGIAICDREEFLQVAGISAPVFNQAGDVVAAISLWDTVDRQDIHALLERRDDLLSAGRAISESLGYLSGTLSEAS